MCCPDSDAAEVLVQVKHQLNLCTSVNFDGIEHQSSLQYTEKKIILIYSIVDS